MKRLRLPRWAVRLLAVLLAFDVGVWAAHAAGVRVNATASMPLGLYRIRPLGTTPLRRGVLVAICPSEAALAVALPRHYLKPGPCAGGVEPFLKEVAAVPGDRIVVSNEGERVNGTALPNSGRLAGDCAGLPIPHIPDGAYRIAPGTVWLYAPSPASWDSRYYGADPVRNVVGVATPILLVGQGNPCG